MGLASCRINVGYRDGDAIRWSLVESALTRVDLDRAKTRVDEWLGGGVGVGRVLSQGGGRAKQATWWEAEREPAASGTRSAVDSE